MSSNNIGYVDAPGVEACLAPQYYNTDGTPKETKSPKSPTNAPNSGPKSQLNGSSLPKPAQGVIAQTITDINNALPVAGCPISLPAIFTQLQTKMELIPLTMQNVIKEYATELAAAADPLVQDIMNAIETVKKWIDIVKKWVDEIMEYVKLIQKWILDTIELINFIMTLPERLMRLVINCMNKLISGVTEFVGSAFDSVTSGITSGLSSDGSLKGNQTTEENKSAQDEYSAIVDGKINAALNASS